MALARSLKADGRSALCFRRTAGAPPVLGRRGKGTRKGLDVAVARRHRQGPRCRGVFFAAVDARKICFRTGRGRDEGTAVGPARGGRRSISL